MSATLTLATPLTTGSFTVNGTSAAIDLSAPVVKSAVFSGIAAGSTITLTYDKTLNSSIVPAAGDFKVVDNGTAVSLYGYVQVNSNTVVLTLSSAISNATDPITVSYIPGANVLQSSLGTNAAEFDLLSATAEPASALATVSSPKAVAAIGATATISWTNPTSGTTPASYNLEASVNGGAYTTVESGILNSATTATYTGLSGQSVAFKVVSVGTGTPAPTVESTATTAITLDSVAPALTSAVVNGNIITLTYSKPVQTATTGASFISEYGLTGTAATISSGTISGNTVTLKLNQSVLSTDTVKIQYTNATAGNAGEDINDVVGNQLVNDATAGGVTNDTIANAGTLSLAGSTSTSSAISEKLTLADATGTGVDVSSAAMASIQMTAPDGTVTTIAPTANNYILFNAQNTAGNYVFNMTSLAGVKYQTTLAWTAPTSVVANATGVVDATNGTEFALGTPALSLTANTYVVAPDGTVSIATVDASHNVELNGTSNGTYTIYTSTAGNVWSKSTVSYPNSFTPTVSSATVNGTTMVLNYNVALSGTPAASAFSVMDNGTSDAVTNVAVSGTTVTLTLTNAVLASDTGTVSYTAPTTTPLVGVTGNAIQAASFTGQSVTDNTTVSSLVSAAAATGTSSVVLTYSSALSATSATTPPAATSYTVTVNGANDAVTGVIVNAANKTVTLALSANVAAGQTVVVNYNKPTTNSLTDAIGNNVAGFSNQIVGVQ